MANVIQFLLSLNRHAKVAVQVLADVAAIILSFAGAVFVRLESTALLDQPKIWISLGIATVAVLIALWFGGLYRVLVRYITGKILTIVGKGLAVGAVALYAAGIALDAGLPRSVPIIFAIFGFLSVSGIRFGARTFIRKPNHTSKEPVIIYGAGEAGLQLLNSLFHGREYSPVALIDDDPRLHRMEIGGLNVFASDQIPRLVQETGAQAILLAMPRIGRARRQEIIKRVEDLKLEIKTIPGMADIISGKAKISELETVSAEDLLGRDPVAPYPELLGKNITGQVVMVTGAGGSIGSELCRQILHQKPDTLMLYEVSEVALYSIEAELSSIVTDLSHIPRILPLLGSVQDKGRLKAAMEAFNVQTVYHAAAYKHVPLVEENVVEGIRNNIFGTLNLTSAARELGVENVILISTDKAVRPTNIMGVTKRVAELICQAHAQKASNTVFSMVRFGNVLGSSGSVIPRFRQQIENGGPVTVTHKDINRYFMTIPEAAELVIQAGAMGTGGDVFVLDMGEPVRIMDLATAMVKLHGLTPYLIDDPDQVSADKGDVPIYVTGLRKGEKLYEELLIGNDPSATQHPRIMTASEVTMPMDELMVVLDRLRGACENFDLPEIVSILHEMPVEYAPQSKVISDVLWHANSATERRQDDAINEGA